MSQLKLIPLLCFAGFFLGGCNPFWNPAGARAIHYDEFDTIYYQTSIDHSKAYFYFSQPKRLIVGMSLATRWDNKVEKYGVYFGGVSDTAGHRGQYDTASLLRATWTNNLWMIKFDISPSMPGHEFRMYYETKDGPWGIQIPFKGAIKN